MRKAHFDHWPLTRWEKNRLIFFFSDAGGGIEPTGHIEIT